MSWVINSVAKTSNMTKRFHECSAIVKVVRWIRYIPVAYIRGCFGVLLWILFGAEPVKIGDCGGCVLTRWETACGFIRREIGRGQIRMGLYVTTEELKEMSIFRDKGQQ